MKTYVVTYGYPINQTFLVKSDSGITASCGPEETLKKQGWGLDKVQVFIQQIFMPVIEL